MSKYVTQIKTPVGTIILTGSEKYLTSLQFEKSLGYYNGYERTNAVLDLAIAQLEKYFIGELKTFSIPLQINGTEFQKRCWKFLLEIPYARTMTYKEQAIKVGGASYARAVAGANNKNPLPIIIPCHRIIGSDNSLVGYSAGIGIKNDLLKLEKNNIK